MNDPFLRWAGGKRWLAPTLKERLIGFEYRRYIEPFIGGGAIFFNIAPSDALIGDLNPELIATYNAVKRYPHALKKKLASIPVTEEMFYRMRANKPRSIFDRAVRFIYLNRTCFCGLYRVNQKGEFNVPYGGGSRSQAVLINSNILESSSSILKKAEIKCCDFEPIINSAKNGDIVFCDPTYVQKKRGNRFDRYNDKIFSWKDQIRLSTVCRAAVSRGASVIVSNISCEEVRALYKFGVAVSFSRNSALCSTTRAGAIEEAVIFCGDRLLTHLSSTEQAANAA